jgi:hypothetical protein
VQIRSWTEGAHVIPTTTVPGDSVDVPISAEGETILHWYVEDNAGNTSAQHGGGSAKLDKTKPTITAPKHKFVAVTKLQPTTIPVTVYNWKAGDPLSNGSASGLNRYWLQQSVDGGAWQTLTLPSLLAPSDVRYLEPGHSYKFQIRAVDNADNTGIAAVGTTFALNLHQDNAAAIAYTGGWSAQNHAYAIGGTARETSTAGQTATFTFNGTSVAWVATRGDNRGRAEVRIDGVLKATIDLYNVSLQGRRIVFAQNVLSPGQHTIQIKVLGTKNASSSGTLVDVDAFVVISYCGG